MLNLRTLLRAASLVLLLVALVSAQTIEVPHPDSPGPWTSLKVTAGADDFHFAIVSDRTGGMRPGVFESAMPKLNLLRPDFVVNIGDLIPGYTSSAGEIDAEWADLFKAVGQLKMPFFFVPGNHDFGEPATAADWLKRFGRPYYHFSYRNVLFLVLNGIHPGEHGLNDGLDDAQFEYFKKALADNPNVRWTVVLTHYPLWTMEKTGRWPDLEKLLAERKHTVFAGHYHNYTKFVRHGQSYIVLATTGGGSRLRGDTFGELDHLVWITMTDGGPQIANLNLDGIRDENIRDEALANFVDLTARVDPVYISPLYLQAPLPAEASVTISLRNTFGHAFTFTASFESNDVLTPVTAKIEKEVAPGATVSLDLRLKVRPDADLAAFKPLVASYQWSVKLDGHSDVGYDGSRKIGQAVAGDRWVVEAEDMVLDGGYMVRQFPNGRAAIRLKWGDKPPVTLKATLPFPGPTGRYKVTLVGIPDGGGSSRLSLFAGGAAVFTGTLDRKTGTTDVSVDQQEFVIPEVSLQHGQELRLEGVPEGTAVAFVDKIIFEPVSGTK